MQDDRSDIELFLNVAEAEGATVAWSDCERCDRPREEHIGPARLCPS